MRLPGPQPTSQNTPAAPNGAAGALSGLIIQTLHLVGVELEKVGDDFGFGRVGRKAVGGKHGAEVGELCPCFRAVNCTSV